MERSFEVRNASRARHPAMRERLAYLDGLRGIAIGAVLLYHTWLFSNCPLFYWWNPIRFGHYGVNLFLTLSGFCLYWPIVRPGAHRREPTLKVFARRRARRILPPYYAAIFCCIALSILLTKLGIRWPDDGLNTNAATTIKTVLWHLSLLHNLLPEHVKSISGPMWSLGLEASLYVAMPLLVVLARYGVIKAVMVCFFISLVYRNSLWWYLGGTWSSAPVFEAHYPVFADVLFGRMTEFGLGMLAAEITARGIPASLKRWSLPAIISCIAAAIAVTEYWGDDSTTAMMLIAVACFFLILHSCSASESGKWHPTRLSFIVTLGTLSYSLYLIHQPLLRLGLQAISVKVHSHTAIYAIGMLVLLPAIFIVSIGFHKIFERPFMNPQPTKVEVGEITAPVQPASV